MCRRSLQQHQEPGVSAAAAEKQSSTSHVQKYNHSGRTTSLCSTSSTTSSGPASRTLCPLLQKPLPPSGPSPPTYTYHHQFTHDWPFNYYLHHHHTYDISSFIIITCIINSFITSRASSSHVSSSHVYYINVLYVACRSSHSSSRIPNSRFPPPLCPLPPPIYLMQVLPQLLPVTKLPLERLVHLLFLCVQVLVLNSSRGRHLGTAEEGRASSSRGGHLSTALRGGQGGRGPAAR